MYQAAGRIAPAEKPADQLSHFRLLEEIGSGGMATVYRGEDLDSGREVAIKILHPHLSKNPESQKRFEREAQAVAALRHRNIIEVFAYEKSPTCFIVSEYIHGQNLGEFLKDRLPVFPEAACLVLYEIAEGLRQAHAAGVLHRDIKPENIIISKDGRLKLVDFGIAHVQGLETMTMTGALVGSPSYMAPEMLDGKRATFRTDIFSLGILFYYMLTGQLPFRGETTVQVLKRISEGVYDPVRKANPRVGSEIGSLVDRMLKLDPNDRIPTMSAVQSALGPILAASGISVGQGVEEEVRRYFVDPENYSRRISQRVISRLIEQGRRAGKSSDTQVLFNVCERVLAIDQGNVEALALLEDATRTGPSWSRIAIYGAIALLITLGGLWLARDRWMQGPELAAVPVIPVEAPKVAINQPLPPPVEKAPADAAVESPAPTDAVEAEAGTFDPDLGVVTMQPSDLPLVSNTASAQPARPGRVEPAAVETVSKVPVPKSVTQNGNQAAQNEESKPVFTPSVEKRREAKTVAKPSEAKPKVQTVPKPPVEPASEPVAAVLPGEAPIAPDPPVLRRPTGTVKVRALLEGKPIWANLFINGKDQGRFMNSRTFELEEGEQAISLVNPCCDPVKDLLNIVADREVEREYPLTLKPAIVQIEVDRPAVVVIDGEDMGVVQMKGQFKLPHGRHMIQVGAKGYTTQEIVSNFAAGQVTPLAFTLVPESAP